MRIFKNKWFERWARKEGVSDESLLDAASEIIAGKVEADLGSYLFKKRLPSKGMGKRGGYRVIVGYKKPNTERIVFLYAFSKSAKANITTKEEAALSLVAENFVLTTGAELQKLIENGSIWEVKSYE
jgi:hypothetical protein